MRSLKKQLAELRARGDQCSGDGFERMNWPMPARANNLCSLNAEVESAGTEGPGKPRAAIQSRARTAGSDARRARRTRRAFAS